MKEYTSDVLRKLQLTELKIYQDFAAFLRSNGLTHMVMDGTLLGAVRHGGFIPWDDDMDIMMPRKDYERFIKIADTFCDVYEVLSIERTEGYVLPFAKVCKKGTSFIEDTDRDRKYQSGIFIDVSPFDETSADIKKRRKQIKQTFRLARIIVLTEYRHPKLPQGMHPTLKKIAWTGCSFIHSLFKLFGINKQMLYRKYLRKARQYEGGGWWMNITDYFTANTMHPEDVFFPPTPLSFEGVSVPAFHRPEAYLKSYYGDYMTIPPKEKQRNHAPFALDFGEES